jgi:CcmD family protein
LEGTTGYLIAGYVLTWAVLGLYVWRMSKREREARAALGRPDPGAPSGERDAAIQSG